jgi:hypothetical protein
MTDFNFLRIKWPKLAAIAADASRLVEVSPASAVSTMQGFCEWAADIALDMYDISTQNGITQQEKLETLKATGHVPTDVLGRFQNVMLAGQRRLYRQNEDVEEARICLEDIYEVGRWLNKEADRAGWPPRSEYYHPIITPLGMQADGGGGGFTSSGGFAEKLKGFQPFIFMGIGAVVVVALAVFGIVLVLKGPSGTPSPTLPVITPTPTVSTTPMLRTEPGTDITPSPEPETFKYVDELTITGTQNTFYKKLWKFKSGDIKFTIGDQRYENGIGLYIVKSYITKTQGTMTLKCKLDATYEKVIFDLGADANIGYGTGYGKYRIQIYCDSDKTTAIYDSNLNEYTFTDLGVTANLVSGCETLVIKLTEQKGTKGTINVVLGALRLVNGGGTGTAEPSGSSSATASSGTAGSSSPSATTGG